jgi:hypothetical protein
MHVRSPTTPDDQRLEASQENSMSVPYSALNVDAGVFDLALDGRLCRESASEWSEPSKRWRDEDSCSAGRLGESSR